MFTLFSLFYALFYSNAFVAAFSFSASDTVSECDDFSVEWSGGTGPYQLLIVPSFGTPRNISIPSSAYSNGQGSYTMQMPFPEDQQLVLTMSDATGFGAGGTTTVLTVGESQGGRCNTTDPGIDFPFQLNYALQQCRPYTFEGFGSAAQPVTIWIVVPGGTSTTVQVPTGSQSHQWVASIPGGTSAMFMMTDARGGQGGASDVKFVGASDDRSCLNGQALSSTRAASATSNPTRTNQPDQSATESSATSSAASGSDAAKGVPISAIAGTVIGSLLFLAVIVTLGLFFLKNFKNKRDKLKDAKRRSGATTLNYDYYDHQRGNPYGAPGGPQSYGPSSTNLTGENPFADYSSPYHNPEAAASYDPFQSRPSYPPTPGVPTPTSFDPFNPSAPPVLPPPMGTNDRSESSAEQSSTQDTMTSGQRKAALAGVSGYKPSRFIVHTDAEDELPPPNDDGVVELPPVYTERSNRGPSN